MNLGKRKRATVVARREDYSKEEEDGLLSLSPDTHAVFRKYFEAQFDPLPATSNTTPSLREDDSEFEDSDDSEEGEIIQQADFSGFSDVENDAPVVEIVEVEHKVMESENNAIDKIFRKSYMTSKPPQDLPRSTQALSKTRPKDDESEEETTNLKHDLDLQRLLRESHLLSKTQTTTLSGKQRHQATDMRLLDLGSKTSLYKQENMPLSHRKGIAAKAVSMETQRRKHAQENGIILERQQNTKSRAAMTKRDRGVDVPALGAFRGGTLQLSRKDVASIQGHPSGRGRGSKKRGRR